jgi:ABC-type transport system involved in multi-copper enzyme maturation permease subunit
VNVNPVLQRELRERMRGQRAMYILTAYLALLVGIFYFVYHAQAGTRTGLDIVVAPTEVAQIGRGIYEWVLFFMMLLVLFLVPGLTSGAIAGERERQTLIPMQVTLLKPRSIVLGKISASLAFLFLLIVAALPLFSLSYLIGGISLTQALEGLAIVVVTGIVYACITVGCSALVKRVQTATVLAYGVVLVTVMGTFLVYTAAGLVDGTPTLSATSTSKHPPAVILVTNPLALTAAVIARDPDTKDTGARANSPFEPIRRIVEPLRRDGTAGGGSSSGSSNPGTTVPPTTVPLSAPVIMPGGGFVGGGIAFTGPAVGVSGTVPGTTVPAASGGGGGGGPSGATFVPFIQSSLLLMVGFAVAAIWLASIRLRIPAELER